MSTVPIVIVGNGVAGVTAAATVASLVPGTEIAIYSTEKYPYYRRPWLPDFLAGKYEATDLYAYPESWYENRNIRVHLESAVSSIDADAHRVALAAGDEISYAKLLLACGGKAWIPPVKNTDLTGVFTLRTLDDAIDIREYARNASSAVIVGGGLLGLECARGLGAAGLKVTVVEVFPRLLPRQLDEEGAAVLSNLIEDLGITVVTGATVETVVGEDKARGVQLKSGTVLPGELVLFSAGIRPDTTLAKGAGLAVNRGVVTNAQMQTSTPDVFVAGDMAEFEERVYGIIPAAIEQARVAAANMVTPGTATYTGTTPSNTLKVVGIDLTSIGVVNPEEPDYVSYSRAVPDKGVYKKLVFKDDTLVGAILLGDRESVRPVTRLMARGAKIASVGPRLLDDDFDLKSLL